MLRGGLCLLLLATPLHAQGITSFEPDTTRGRVDREPMVETPIWYGTSVSMGSVHERGWRGLGNAPDRVSGTGLSVTWPWRTRWQGWSELSYGLRRMIVEFEGEWFNGTTYVPYVWRVEERLALFTVRTGVEHRFGARGLPWCTAGVGAGYAVSVGEEPVSSAEAVVRIACFTYPSRRTRLGLMVSGGPEWMTRPGTILPLVASRTEGEIQTHVAVSLRIESRLRFPQANAD